MSTDRVKDITVLVKTDRGLFECKLGEELKKWIYFEIEKKKMVLIDQDLTEVFTNLKINQHEKENRT